MAFGVTSEGFSAKKFADIVSEVGESFLTELGIDIDSDPDSVAKILTNIYSLALSEEWALTQSLQSMFDIDKSEGKHLDDLVGYVGLSRLSSAPSKGKVYVTASKELTIPSGSEFKDVDGNIYPASGTILVTRSSCTNLTLELADTIIVGNILTVVINGVTSSITVTSTPASALTLLIDNINNNSATNLVTATDTSEGLTLSISISNTNDQTASVVTNSSNLILTSVTSFGTITKDVDGAFGVSASVVTIAPDIANIDSVINRYPFTTGRLIESDIDLRTRHALSLSTAGAGTVEAIRSDILVVDGVTTAFVIENDTLFPSVNNIPAKSFLLVVKGGTDQDIGDALWLTKGAGIQTDGDVQVAVIDSQGETQYVNFSRPTPVYLHVNVDYTLYDEQSDEFPVNGEDQIIDQVVAYGESLDVGEDVIPQRIATQIFNNIGGLGVVNVTIGSTVGANDPVPILTQNILSVSSISEAAFAEARTTVAEV